MNNNEVTTIREFRRFVTTYLYDDTNFILTKLIQNKSNSTYIEYECVPRHIIKFNYNSNNANNYTEEIKSILKSSFIEYFNNTEVIKIIRNKIYNNVNDQDTKNILNEALYQIQIGNCTYISLLFNFTILDNIIYIYL